MIKTNPDHPVNSIDLELPNVNGGLTKREHFAAMAMQGLLANESVYKNSNLPSVSELAVKQADALIEALNK